MKKLCLTCQHHEKNFNEQPCKKCSELGDRRLWESKEEPLFPVVLPDMVNHPSHYNQGKYECIDVMVETFGKEATMDFCLLNAFKYVWRTGEKNGAEDVKKADWYLHKFLELEGKKDD